MQISDKMVRAALTAYCGPNLYTPEESMRAALEAALAAMWRPIEEAPTKTLPGEFEPPVLLLWDGNRIRLGQFNHQEHNRIPRPYWRYLDSVGATLDRREQPTNFMPLPSPPKMEG